MVALITQEINDYTKLSQPRNSCKKKHRDKIVFLVHSAVFEFTKIIKVRLIGSGRDPQI